MIKKYKKEKIIQRIMNEEIFEIKCIEKSLILTPEHLNQNIHNLIFNILKNQCENTCIKNIGFIKKVIKIKEIVHDEIMKMTPNLNIRILLEIESYLPKIGDKIKIKVDLIFSHGIFANFNSLKVLIPIHHCGNYSLIQDFAESYLKNKGTNQTIKKNDIIEIEITNIRFEKENYSCLGKID